MRMCTCRCTLTGLSCSEALEIQGESTLYLYKAWPLRTWGAHFERINLEYVIKSGKSMRHARASLIHDVIYPII